MERKKIPSPACDGVYVWSFAILLMIIGAEIIKGMVQAVAKCFNPDLENISL
jgi:hypothetical protein